ncbi:DUF5723 family protein [Tenacibaculum halocynthiae]|uniref:DUF5723 family protein n=1 Tax=Tenacibaculum halocynthiae TaxID=1254437 RepID=UPI003D659C28
MKKLLIILITLFGVMSNSYGQNKQILYGFDEIPQTLLLNPGAVTNYKYHVGIPLMSNISANVGITGVTIADIFRNDGVDFTTKYRNALNKLSENDYIQVNSQIEVLNGGYKLNERDYITAGFYTEMDAFATIPKDILSLINEGNASNVNRSFLLSQASVKAEFIGVLHFGISRTLNKKLTVGTRLKIYSGAVSVTSTGNTGSFTTRLGQNNIYSHYLNNINISGNSSGIYDENNESNLSAGTLLGRTFFGGNLGLGVDIGFTYKLNDQTEITASLLDLGFISYSQDVRNGTMIGDFVFSGIEFQYDATNPDYWGDIDNEFRQQVPRAENKESYTVARPIKFNSSIKHSWGKSRREDNCHDISYNDYFDNAIGAQLFSVIRPNGPKFALTGFLEKRLFESIKGKVTYTVDDFSYSNLGIGVSAKLGKVNVFGMVDNLFKITDIADANQASFQIGVNLIFK